MARLYGMVFLSKPVHTRTTQHTQYREKKGRETAALGALPCAGCVPGVPGCAGRVLVWQPAMQPHPFLTFLTGNGVPVPARTRRKKEREYFSSRTKQGSQEIVAEAGGATAASACQGVQPFALHAGRRPGCGEMQDCISPRTVSPCSTGTMQHGIDGARALPVFLSSHAVQHRQPSRSDPRQAVPG